MTSKHDVFIKLANVLADEILYCAQNNQEVSEFSVDTLHEAIELGASGESISKYQEFVAGLPEGK